MNIAPAELRRRNFITQFPYTTPLGMVYDTGDFNRTLDRALQLADVSGFAQRKADAARLGLLRGLGYCCYLASGGSAPSHVVGALGGRAGLFESAEVRVHPTGKVSVFTGSHSHGQGHETTFAQVVAERLGIAVEDVDIVHGDTARVLFGMGTYGSRSLAVGGTAIVKAVDKVIEKGRKIAAHLLEAADADVEFKNGQFQVMGTDRRVAFAQVALTAYVPHNYPIDRLEPGLNEQAFYDPVNCTFPAGAHLCEVEVDPETGATHIVGYTAVDDFGNVINPLIVAGQVTGGVAQGLGQALLEQCRYDPSTGQLLNGSYLDYAMPRADELPEFTLATEVTPCTSNPLGVKGCGEAGAIAAPGALMNALTDALGVRHLDMPATAERVWRALRAAGTEQR
jgi:carbon-monoxide dehydrogenase large subunit